MVDSVVEAIVWSSLQ